MDEILKESSVSVISYLSNTFDGLSKEDRRQRLVDCLNTVEFGVESTQRCLLDTKDDIEAARIKYENMNDLMKTMEQLKCSLEEHIKTVRLNEGSFAGTAAVLEYDIAKSRTNTLINVIKARTQLDNAKDALADGGDDQQRIFESLVDMQQSYETIGQFVSNHIDDKALEELKDRYLGWQSAALVFAIKQADYEKLAEIQRAYDKLGRKDDFLGTFKRVSINRLKEFTPSASSLSSLISSLKKEVEFVYKHHYKIVSRFLPSTAAVELLTSSILEGLGQLSLEESISGLLSDVANPVSSMVQLQKDLDFDISSCNAMEVDLLNHVNNVIKAGSINPIRSSLTSYVLSMVNRIDLVTGSFNTRLANFNVSVEDILRLIYEMLHNVEQLYGSDARIVVAPAIEKALESFLVKIKAWEYGVSSSGAPRPLADLANLCRSSGQMMNGLNAFKKTVDEFDASMSPNLKGFNKWNRGVVESILSHFRQLYTAAINAVLQGIDDAKKASVSVPTAENKNLAYLMVAPSEHITTLGQVIFQIFRGGFEEFFLDDNISASFVSAFKNKYDKEGLFKKLMNETADKIMSDYVSGIAQDVTNSAIHQILKDTEFLKDGFDDLRTGDTSVLTNLMDNLSQRV